jgi:hypothetical protein
VARLYLDNDVALRLVPILEGDGHAVTTTRDLGCSQAHDYQQMLTAWSLGAVLVTHNRDDYVEQFEAWHVCRGSGACRPQTTRASSFRTSATRRSTVRPC